MAYKKSQWFLALLDAEQHIHEGYSTHTLKQALSGHTTNGKLGH